MVTGPVWDPTDAQAAQVRLGSSGNAEGATGGGGNGNSATNGRTVGIAVGTSLLPFRSLFLTTIALFF